MKGRYAVADVAKTRERIWTRFLIVGDMVSVARRVLRSVCLCFPSGPSSVWNNPLLLAALLLDARVRVDRKEAGMMYR